MSIFRRDSSTVGDTASHSSPALVRIVCRILLVDARISLVMGWGLFVDKFDISGETSSCWLTS